MRFERDISRRAARLVARLFQRDSFCVFDLIEEIKAFADNLLIRIDDDGPDQRTGADLADALRGQLERTLHHLTVEIVVFVQLRGATSQYHLRQQVGSFDRCDFTLSHPLTRVVLTR
jgi:hypothetical protein